MNTDLKKLITETVEKVFANAPEKPIERGVREIYYDICPHCKTEIHEKHEYTEDGGVTWRHSDCKGLIARPETPIEEIGSWLRPYVQEARDDRKAARKALGMPENVVGLPPSGEEKYDKQQQEGPMAAVNTTNLTTEVGHRGGQPLDPYEKADDETGIPPASPDNDPADPDYDTKKPTVILHPHPELAPRHQVNETGVEEKEESKPVAPRDFGRFADDAINFVNASNIPLKVTVTEFKAMADTVHSVKTYIIWVNNG